MTPGNGPEKLFHLLKLAHGNGALITVTLGGPFLMEAVGHKLQGRHAYTLTGVNQVRGGRDGKLWIPLLRLRDPHGQGITAEWEGDWGDDSSLWEQIPARQRKRLRSQGKDGEFYLSFYKDFLRYFRELDLIHLSPVRIELNSDRQTRKFLLAELTGEWRQGEAGATTGARGYQSFHRNPQFPFSLSNCRDVNSTCTVIVCLSQKLDSRKATKSSIGFRIYKGCPETGTLDRDFVQDSRNLAAESGAFVNSRDVSSSFTLPRGRYCIIPSTFAAEESGEFYLRLYVDDRWRCSAPVPMVTVRDYTAKARAAQRCRSFWRTLCCCSCACCCCCCSTGEMESQGERQGQGPGSKEEKLPLTILR